MKKSLYLISVFALFITACSEDMISSKNTSNNAIPIDTVKVERTSFKKTMKLVGKTVPSQQVPITSSVPSQVKTVHVEQGQTVQSGDLLFSLEDDAIRQQLTQARSTVSALEKSRYRLDTAIQQQNAAQSRVQNIINETIDELNDITLPEQVETDIEIGNIIEALNQLKGVASTGSPLSSSTLPLINSQLEQARKGVRETERALQATKVNSPIDGTVTQVNAQAGSPALPSTPLATVSSSGDLKAAFTANEFQIQDLKEGMPVKLGFTNDADTFESTLGTVSTKPNPNSNTYTVSVPLNDNSGNIKSDIVITATIETSVKENVLTVSNETILYEQNTPYVFIVRNGKAVKQVIQLLDEGENVSYVGKGLNEGDLVVTNGKYQLTNHSKISMKK